MSIVPDAITPVEGWKMLALNEHNKLNSPAYPLIWEPGKAAEAVCSVDCWEYRWVPSSAAPPPEEEQPLFRSAPVSMSAMAVTFMTGPAIPAPSKPRTILPQGKHWVMEHYRNEHAAPLRDCSCGIYIASDINTVLGYSGLLVKVQGWGTTIKHQAGWRVQYAYPSHIYAYSLEEAELLIEYGVPVTLMEDVTNPMIKNFRKEMEKEVVRETAEQVAIRRILRWTPVVLVGAATLQAVIIYNHFSVLGTVLLFLYVLSAMILFLMSQAHE